MQIKTKEKEFGKLVMGMVNEAEAEDDVEEEGGDEIETGVDDDEEEE